MEKIIWDLQKMFPTIKKADLKNYCFDNGVGENTKIEVI